MEVEGRLKNSIPSIERSGSLVMTLRCQLVPPPNDHPQPEEDLVISINR